MFPQSLSLILAFSLFLESQLLSHEMNIPVTMSRGDGAKKNAEIITMMDYNTSTLGISVHPTTTLSATQAHLVAQRTYRSGLEPSLNAVQVEHVPTAPERDRKTIFVVRRRICLENEQKHNTNKSKR